jgi:2-keto-3-deoxy-L-rhamnonate aldolase RhmA
LREDETRKVLGAGFVFVAVGSDVALFARQVDALAQKFRSA